MMLCSGLVVLTGDHLLNPLWGAALEKVKTSMSRDYAHPLAELRNGLLIPSPGRAEWLALRRFSPMCSPAKRRRYDARVERRLTDLVSPSESAPDDQSDSDGDTHSAHSPELSPLLTRAMTVDMDLLPLVDVDLPDLPQVRLCSPRRTDSSCSRRPRSHPPTDTQGHPRLTRFRRSCAARGYGGARASAARPDASRRCASRRGSARHW